MEVLIVVVRYKIPLEESQTMVSLSAVFRVHPELMGPFGILVWDNSPAKLDEVQAPFVLEYRYSERNLGVSGAYNYATDRAESWNCPWLLLLDQDTTVSDSFLQRMLEYSREFRSDTRIATVVPFVYSHGRLVSPRKFGPYIRNQQISRSVTGIFKEDAYAVNSGTLMRVSALREVGGYSEEFWLDLSDAYIFQAFHRRGKWMYIAEDLDLSHSIASLDFDREMGADRYRNFLAAENLYLGLYRSFLVNCLQTFWLLARAGRQYRRYRNKKFAKITLSCFLKRLLLSRKARMRLWASELRQRDIPAISNGQVIG